MPLRNVKLVADAREKALELGVPVGFLQDEDAYNRAVESGDGTFNVRNRDYHLLLAHGLIEEASLVNPAADQPEAEKAQVEAKKDNLDKRSHSDVDLDKNEGGTINSGRGPSGTDRGVHPGGAGHQPNDGYDNANRVQADIRQDQGRGEAQRKEEGRGPVKDEELDENLRREGRLPEDREKESRDQKENEKQQRKAERETEKAQKEEAKSQEQAEKNTAKDKAEHEKSAAQASGGSSKDVRKDADAPKSGQRDDQGTAGRSSAGDNKSKGEAERK